MSIDSLTPKKSKQSSTSPPISRVVSVGALNLDEEVRLGGVMHPGASNPASFQSSLGGVATNACIASQQWLDSAGEQSESTEGSINEGSQKKGSLKKIESYLISVTGNDAGAVALTSAIDQSGITPLLHALPDFATGRYTAVLDDEGHLVLGLSDSSICENLTTDMIDQSLATTLALSGSNFLLFDANLDSTTISTMLNRYRTFYRIALSVSPVKSMRLVQSASNVDLLFTNRLEAAMLSGIPKNAPLTAYAKGLVSIGFSNLVITDSEQPLLVVSDQQSTEVAVPAREKTPLERLNDIEVPRVTGAGDALAGATTAALASGYSLLDAVRLAGLPAATNIINRRVQKRVVT